MKTMYKVKCNITKGMLCASCDAVGHTLKVTNVREVFGHYYVTARSIDCVKVKVEGRDKDFIYKVSSPELFHRIVSGDFNPVTGE